MFVNPFAIDIANENIGITAKISHLISIATIEPTAIRRTFFYCNSSSSKLPFRQFYIFKKLFFEYITNTIFYIPNRVMYQRPKNKS